MTFRHGPASKLNKRMDPAFLHCGKRPSTSTAVSLFKRSRHAWFPFRCGSARNGHFVQAKPREDKKRKPEIMNDPLHRPQVVGILGGMGPAAGADFTRLFVRACESHLRQSGAEICDQAFPEHWLAQVPVPDRSSALDDAGLGGHQPLEPMLQAIGKLAALGTTTIALACNTAHAWHSTLQARFPQLDVLHVAREVARDLARRGIREAGLMATAGTYRAGLYEQAFEREGLRCHLPSETEREQLMRGIYGGVKAGNLQRAEGCFADVAKAMARRFDLSVMIMGCTEIPLALRAVQGMDALELVDPAALLARVLARRAYGLPAEGAEPARVAGDE